MNIDSNTEATEISLDIENDNLDEFNDLFLGKAKPQEQKEEKQEIQEKSEDATEDLEAQEEQEPKDEEGEPQKPKSRFQERISELTRAKKEAEARAAAALAELEAFKSDKKTVDAPVKEAAETPTKDDTPTAEDLNEDGSPKYPLGEFDPGFIRDLTRHTIKKEQEAEAIRQDEIRKAKQEQAKAQALQDTWQEKLNETVKEKPDFVEKAQVLETTFRDLDPSYGDYLAQTIMSMEAGPEVLYYLANNVEEAQEIADLGAVKATIALGHLEAALTTKNEITTKQTRKVSQAPEPPSAFTKGTKGYQEVTADTDDLDDFANLFFKKKK